MTLALLAAAGGALAYGAGSVLQAAGARRAAEHGRGLAGVAVQLPYLAGLGLDLAGWLLSLLALRGLPLFAVQAILASSLAVTIVLAAATIGSRVQPRDLILIGATVAALVVIAAAAGPENPRPAASWIVVALIAGIPVVGAAALALALWASPVATSVLAGLAFGLAAFAARALHTTGDLVAVTTDPLALAIAAYGVVGLIAYAHALERGDVGIVTAALWVSEIVVPGAIGIAVLGDQVRAGWAVPGVIATAVAIASTVGLARSGARAMSPLRGVIPESMPPARRSSDGARW